MEIELIKLDKAQSLKMIFKSQSAIEFWKKAPEIEYNELKKTTVWLISVFRATYCTQ